MAYKPTRMDKINRILALQKEGKKIKQISRTLGMSKNTVKKHLRRHQNHIPSAGDKQSRDLELVHIILGKQSSKESERESKLTEQLPKICTELKRVGVTRHLLWKEYIEAQPDGFSYSRFCARVKQYESSQDVTLLYDALTKYFGV